MPRTVVQDVPIISVNFGNGGSLFAQDSDGNKNFLSFTHFFIDKEAGATLSFIDPDGKFEENFAKYKFNEAVAAALRKIGGNSSGPLTGAMSKEEGGGGGGGSSGGVLDLSITYGYPGQTAGPYNFTVHESSVSYSKGARVINLTMVPFVKNFNFYDKKGLREEGTTGGSKSVVIGQSSAFSLGNINYGGASPINFGVGSVDIHKMVMDAVSDFAVAACGTGSVRVVVPNISNAVKGLVADKLAAINKKEPDKDKTAVAVEVLHETLAVLGLDLHIEDSSYIANPKQVPMSVAATVGFKQERDRYKTPESAREGFTSKHVAWAEFRVEADRKFSKVHIENAIRDFCSKVGAAATNEWPVNPHFLWLNHAEDMAKAGLGGSLGLICGDKGMVCSIMGHQGLANSIGHPDDKGSGGGSLRPIRSDMFTDTTWTTPTFTFNPQSGDGNVLELNVTQQEHYLQQINQGVAKAIQSYATINTSPAPRKSRFTIRSFVSTFKYAYAAAQANGASFAAAVGAAVMAYSGVRSKTAKPWMMLTPDSNQSDGGGAIANIAIIAYQQGFGSRIKTLPCFDLSRSSDLGRACQLNGRDVTYVDGGSPHGGMSPPWTGKHVLLGFKHVLSNTDAYSEFDLRRAE